MWLRYTERKLVELFANSGDPDQTLHSVASGLGLHCLPITLLGVSRLQWVKCYYLMLMELNRTNSDPASLISTIKNIDQFPRVIG